MSTWIVHTQSGSGLRVAVKDLIDVAGLPTTAGSRAVARRAAPATADAECLAGLRAAEAAGTASFVGKTNLHEIALGITGINPWFGTPTNPLDPGLVPGGSSSGSAVAVAADEADVAYGSDTGGSIRIPAACCGIAGLKTTWGRISTAGVRPLAPSFDTIGPMARDVAGLVAGMALLEPGFCIDTAEVPGTVGRLRLSAAPAIDAAIDAALSAAEVEVTDVRLDGWEAASEAALSRLVAEAYAGNRDLLASGELGEDVAARLRGGEAVTADVLASVDATAAAWDAELHELWKRVEVLALPTLRDVPPPLERAQLMMELRVTHPVNLAGLPAVALPVPARPLPASLQLVGPKGSEARLLRLAAQVEAAMA